MKVLKSITTDRQLLQERYLQGMQHGGLFIPGVSDISVGEDVCVWCIVREPNFELHIGGTVFWVRHRQGGGAQRLTPGIGVGFKAGQHEQAQYLQRVIAGEPVQPHERRTPRTPVLSPWRCQLHVLSTDSLPRAALLSDISHGGVRLVTGSREMNAGDVVGLSLPWHSTTMHRMQVVWMHESDARLRLGLRREDDERRHEREWNGLVGAARRAFFSQVVGRTPSGEHAEPRFTP
jgi:Tfp pilus assembly protein PilZ